MVVYHAMEGARDYVTLFILLGISGRFAQTMSVRPTTGKEEIGLFFPWLFLPRNTTNAERK